MTEIGEERKQGELLKTGQTTQYGGYADDGYYQKGHSKQYTILTTGQYAGTTLIALYDKTDLISNNCVYDQRTKLMWSRYPTDGLGPASNGKLPWTTNANGEGVFDYAAAANAATLAGYADWRIPNAFELPSLREMEIPTAAPDATAFPSWPTSDHFWTSTTRPNGISDAMLTHFAYGTVQNAGKTNTFFVALVRGG